MKPEEAVDLKAQPVTFSVYDESYFVAFDFANETAFQLLDLPKTCTKSYTRPDPDEDASVMNSVSMLKPGQSIRKTGSTSPSFSRPAWTSRASRLTRASLALAWSWPLRADGPRPVLARHRQCRGHGGPSGPFAGVFMEILAVQRQFFVDLRTGAGGAARRARAASSGWRGLSFAYGVFHAAGPGHGKAVLSSYMLANEVALRRGIVLSFAAALVQALSACVVVALGWFALRGSGLSMTDLAFGLELGSYAMIALVGAWLFARRGWRFCGGQWRGAGLQPAALRRPSLSRAGRHFTGASGSAPGLALVLRRLWRRYL